MSLPPRPAPARPAGVAAINVAPLRTGVEIVKAISQQAGPDGEPRGIYLARTADDRQITLLGEFHASTGDWLRIEANPRDHPIYGPQWVASDWRQAFPEGSRATAGGYERFFLGLRGVGRSAAGRLAAHVAQAGIQALLADPSVFRRCIRNGSDAERAAADLRRYAGECELGALLHDFKVPPAKHPLIQTACGGAAAALERLRTNPWSLASEIPGVTFETLDQIGLRLGSSLASPARIQGGAGYFAQQRCQRNGHTMVPLRGERDMARRPHPKPGGLVEETAERLSGKDPSGRPLPSLVLAIDQVVAALSDAPDLDRVNDDWVGPGRLVRAERAIVRALRRTGLNAAVDVSQNRLDRLGEERGLTPEQRAALRICSRNPVACLTGGPGTGKTTTLAVYLDALAEAGQRCALIAPTGKAAQRMQDVTGHRATTIHRFILEVEAGLVRPLAAVICDEASMLSSTLCAQMLRAASQVAETVLLVGDVDQLEPIDPGEPFAVMIRSGLVATARLEQVHRQDGASVVPLIAADVRAKRMPAMANGPGWRMIVCRTPTEVHERAVESAIEHAARFGQEETMLLAPMYDGVAGVNGLAAALQHHYNPSPPAQLRERGSARRWAVGDRVIHIGQDYQKDPPRTHCQGGVISEVRPGTPPSISVRWDDGRVFTHPAPEGRPTKIASGTATTVHRSQGSEWKGITLALCMNHASLLTGRSFYTAITRGKIDTAVFAEAGVIERALQKSTRRNTALEYLLQSLR